MGKVRVITCGLGLFILPQNWQLAPSAETKESLSKSHHQQMRPVTSLRTCYKAAKLTVLSPLPQTITTFSPPAFITKQNKLPEEMLKKSHWRPWEGRGLSFTCLGHNLAALKAKDMPRMSDVLWVEGHGHWLGLS